MVYIWLIVALINSYAFGSLTPDKQPTASGSANAGSAAACVKTTAGTAAALVAPKRAKPNWNDLSAEQKAKIEAINEQWYDKRGKIEDIIKAIKEGIHPDLFLSASAINPKSRVYDYASLPRDYKDNADRARNERRHVDNHWWATTLSYAVEYNKVDLASFLLQNGANPNQKAFGGQGGNTNPVFQTVKSVAMADLLLKHGAESVLEKHAFKSLTAVRVFPARSELSALVQWYLEHGAPVDREDKTALGLFLKTCPFFSCFQISPAQEADILKTIGIFVEAGADLSQTVDGLTIPRLMADQIASRAMDIQEYKMKTAAILNADATPLIAPMFSEILVLKERQRVLREACDNRQKKATTALMSTLLGTNLIPELITLIAQYSIPSYQKLEAMGSAAASSTAQTAAAPQPKAATAAVTESTALAGGSSSSVGSMEEPRPGMIREDQSADNKKAKELNVILPLCRQYNVYTFVDHKGKPYGAGCLYSERNGKFYAQPMSYLMSNIPDVNRNEALVIDHGDGKRYGILLPSSHNNTRAVVQLPHDEKIIVCERVPQVSAQQPQK